MVEYEHIIIDDLDNRIFSAYATVEVVDNQNDKVLIDKFKKAFYKFLLRGATLSLGHTNYIIGKVLAGEETLDEQGNKAFKVIAQVYGSDSENSIYDEAWEGIKSGKYKGLSIGGGFPKAKLTYEDGATYKEYETVPLMEISLVENPANPLALILGYSMAKGCNTDKDKEDTNLQKENLNEVEIMEESKTIEKQQEISSAPDKLDLILEALAEIKSKLPVEKEEMPIEEQKVVEDPKEEDMEKSSEVGVNVSLNEADKQPAVSETPSDVSDVEVADMKKSLEVMKKEIEELKKCDKVLTPMTKSKETTQVTKSYWDLACEKKEKI